MFGGAPDDAPLRCVAGTVALGAEAGSGGGRAGGTGPGDSAFPALLGPRKGVQAARAARSARDGVDWAPPECCDTAPGTFNFVLSDHGLWGGCGWRPPA